MIKAQTYNGLGLLGTWKVTYKIDGVQATWDENHWISRSGNWLSNMPPFAGYPEVEVYCGSFKKTIQKVTASERIRPVQPYELYSLDPIDERLDPNRYLNFPTDAEIKSLLEQAVQDGYEGLVLRQGLLWVKVKPIVTYDVIVTAIIPGKGKHTGRMGAVMTEKGKVGTGFTDQERYYDYLGKTIEVACMSLTEDGKFRHPRFVRLRPDKS